MAGLGLAAVMTAFLFAGCISDEGTKAGDEKWTGDVDDFLRGCCGGVGIPVEYDTVTDPRDNKRYKTVKISGQRWMAENLNFETPDSSWCYNNADSNCVKYGRLYTLNAAMEACPAGWRLPYNNEWASLITMAGGSYKAGDKLKSTSGWASYYYNSNNTNGKDTYGFSALPGGYRGSGSFSSVGSYGYWWEGGQDGSYGYWSMSNTGSSVSENNYGNKSNGYSARCVTDD